MGDAVTTSSPVDYRRYHGEWQDVSRSSAEVIAPLIIDLCSPTSVIDVGCGLGMWLAVFRRLGVEDVVGVDAEVDRSQLEIPPDRFRSHDLNSPLELERSFDLAVCLEVAEHLTPEAGPGLVRSLTRLTDTVLFSAAVPHQGGVGHLNEQWPDYWAALFQEHGFVPCDAIRPQVWNDDRVAFWYAQNTLLYVERSVLERHNRLLDGSRVGPLSIVHPNVYAWLAGSRYMRTRRAVVARFRQLRGRLGV